jgi:hypothetical protein
LLMHVVLMNNSCRVCIHLVIILCQQMDMLKLL